MTPIENKVLIHTPSFTRGVMNVEDLDKLLQQSRRMPFEKQVALYVIQKLMVELSEEIERGEISPYWVVRKFEKDLFKKYEYCKYIRENGKQYNMMDELNFKGARFGKKKGRAVIVRIWSCYCTFNKRHGINKHCGDRKIRNLGNLETWAQNLKAENLLS